MIMIAYNRINAIIFIEDRREVLDRIKNTFPSVIKIHFKRLILRKRSIKNKSNLLECF